MKKRFALYGMFAAMAIFATACGDDSSSGPDEEESSSSIVSEDESSSSAEEEGKSSAKEKDAKSSSSEAKKDDSSSSEEASSSSSIGNPYADREADPYCNVSLSGDSIILEYGFDEFNQRATFAWNAKKASVVGNGSDCDNIELLSEMLFYEGVLETVNECTVKNLELDEECSFTDMDLFGATTKGDMKNTLEKDFCPYMLSNVMPTEYLNPNVKYGNFIDPRDFVVYKMVKIGNQTWMAQNLRYETNSGSSCYDKDKGNCETYGRLYTLETVQTACPEGWRLPTSAEWGELLTKTMGAESVAIEDPSTGMIITYYSNVDASLLGGDSHANTYGLSLVLGGAYGTPGFESAEYNSIGVSAVYWLGDESVEEKGSFAVVTYFEEKEIPIMYSNVEVADMEFSVRCVKD